MTLRAKADFSAAADTYDTHAQMQYNILQELVALSTPYIKPDALIVDAGCGTGRLSHILPQASIIAVDISETMCRKTLSHTAVCADINALPFKDNTIDMYISSLCWQWVYSLDEVITQMRTVLRRNGLAALAVLTEGTCVEFADACAQSNIAMPLPYYPAHDSLLQKLNPATSYHVVQSSYVHQFESAQALLRHFSLIGAKVTGGSMPTIAQMRMLCKALEHMTRLTYNYTLAVLRYE